MRLLRRNAKEEKIESTNIGDERSWYPREERTSETMFGFEDDPSRSTLKDTLEMEDGDFLRESGKTTRTV